MRVTIIALTLLATPALAQHRAYEASQPQALIDRWGRENTLCRGESDPAINGPACRRRAKVQRQLISAGWYLGREGEAASQFRWHRCGPGSYRE